MKLNLKGFTMIEAVVMLLVFIISLAVKLITNSEGSIEHGIERGSALADRILQNNKRSTK